MCNIWSTSSNSSYRNADIEKFFDLNVGATWAWEIWYRCHFDGFKFLLLICYIQCLVLFITENRYFLKGNNQSFSCHLFHEHKVRNYDSCDFNESIILLYSEVLFYETWACYCGWISVIHTVHIPSGRPLCVVVKRSEKDIIDSFL